MSWNNGDGDGGSLEKHQNSDYNKVLPPFLVSFSS